MTGFNTCNLELLPHGLRCLISLHPLERKTGLEPANLRLGKPTLCQLSYFRIKQFFRVTYLAYTCGPDFSGWIFPSPVTYLQGQIASPIAFVIRFELTPPASCRCAAATPNKIFRSIVSTHFTLHGYSFQYFPTPTYSHCADAFGIERVVGFEPAS